MQNELKICAKCGREVFDGVWTEDTDEFYCDECMDEYVGQCDNCEDYFLVENMIELANGNFVCEYCRDNHCCYCDCCESLYYNDDLTYDNDNELWYCENCEDRHDEQYNTQILSYHSFNNWTLQLAKNENKIPKITMGFELEVDNYCSSESSEILNFITSNIPVVLERDGSVSSGFEIISHPLSWKYIKENEKQFKKVFDYLIGKNYKSHDTNSCGLHIHVNRPSEEVINRILFIMETYKNELIKFSRRTSGNISSWCQFLSDYTGEHEKMKGLEFLKDIKEKSGNNTRYMALNLTNSKTIEFRIFRGTLKFTTFMASLELIYNLVNACSDLKKPLSEITWQFLTKSKYAKKYVNEKEIFTNIIPLDLTSEMLKKYKKLQIAKNKVIKLLSKDLKNVCENYNKLNLPKITINMSENELDTNLNNYLTNITYSYNDITTKVNDLKDYIRKIQNARDMQNLENIISDLNIYSYANNDTKKKINEIINNKGGEQ